MATLMLVNEQWRCIIASYALNQVSFNQYDYFVSAVAGAGATDAAFALKMDTIAAPLYKSVMNVNATYTGSKVFRVTPRATVIPQYSATARGPGTLGAAGTLVPTDVCALGHKTVSTYGRGRSGRVFFPFLDTSQIVGNILTNAAITAYNTLLSDFVNGTITVGAGGNTVTLIPIIWSRKYPTINQTIINYYTETVLAQQRRRGPRGKINLTPPW